MYVVRRRATRNIDRLQAEMEELFHSIVRTGRPVQTRGESGATPAWRPPIEVHETIDALIVVAELAGIAEDQIEVVVDDTVLTVRGERHSIDVGERRTVHAMGILYGPFAADVYLPFPVDLDRIEATYHAGLLRVRLPRVAVTRVAVDSRGVNPDGNER